MRRAFLAGAALAASLVGFGALSTAHFLSTPGGWIGLAAVSAVLAIYALAGAFGWPATARRAPDATTIALRFGAAAAVIYAGEIVLEYVALPADNTSWGLVEFGTVFALFLLAGAGAAWRSRRLGPAALAGVWTAALSALAWFVVVLAVFYAFRGSARQLAVLRAEGDLDDFRRSGLADLQVFLMGDFLGAGFFHLLLGPVIGLALGSLGGAFGLAARRVRRGR